MSDLSKILSMPRGNYPEEWKQVDRILEHIKSLPYENYERLNNKNKKKLFKILKLCWIFYYQKWDNYWYVSIENNIRWFHFQKTIENKDKKDVENENKHNLPPKKSYVIIRIDNNNYTIKIIENISWEEITLSINDKVKIYVPPETGIIETIKDSIFGPNSIFGIGKK